MLVLYNLLCCLALARALPTPNNPRLGVEQDDDDDDTPMEYTVLLSPNQETPPEVLSVLAELELTPESDNVYEVYNNSAFRGFSINASKVHRTMLRTMDTVGVLEKTVELTLAVEQRGGAPWGLERISTGSNGGAERGQRSTYAYDDSKLGTGSDIYIVDTGVYTQHSDFGGRATAGWPATSGQDATDSDGHGTHVAGIAASNSYGVASKANIIGVRSLAGGSGTSSTVIGGLDFALQRHDTQKSRPGFVGSVISMSLSTPYGQKSQTFTNAVNAAVAAGVHVVVAAGNDGQNACEVSPAEAGGAKGKAISVGSIGFDNTVSDFSNTGPCVDVYAPGEQIVSTYINAPNATAYLSGTSMAAPYVTGIVAYQMARDPALAQDPAAMKEWMRQHSLKGVVGGNVLKGDALLLANNGVTVGPVMEAAREQLAAMAVDTV
ncbi:Subtilisin-like protease [Sphaceloma murrayae]|uniref:Subtilisin-like protease n=1 Tax=Sphaceloma murrayae TaxID=2082308 RepID=A0A2K1QSR4_9PEZI|nr:Subtilisin-like protease [Sphaceloma murrayae]